MRRIRLTKKKIVSLAIVIALLSIAAAGTLAYYTDEVVVHNIITTGAVGITLNDKTEQDGVLVDFPEGGITGVMPGVPVSKVVFVAVDQGEAWVRIRLDERIEAADGTQLPMTLADGTPAYTLHMLPDTKWSEGSDGSWYYTEPVAAGEITDRLFDRVDFAPQLDNEYQNCKVYINVTAEAVQTAHNPLPDSGRWEDIPGWPEA